MRHFHFTAPRQGFLVHMNEVNSVLQLQVDQFCLDVNDAVEEWLGSVADDKDIQARLAKLASIG